MGRVLGLLCCSVLELHAASYIHHEAAAMHTMMKMILSIEWKGVWTIRKSLGFCCAAPASSSFLSFQQLPTATMKPSRCAQRGNWLFRPNERRFGRLGGALNCYATASSMFDRNFHCGSSLVTVRHLLREMNPTHFQSSGPMFRPHLSNSCQGGHEKPPTFLPASVFPIPSPFVRLISFLPFLHHFSPNRSLDPARSEKPGLGQTLHLRFE